MRASGQCRPRRFQQSAVRRQRSRDATSRARLLVDWNIGLLFGRDTAELGGVAAVKPPEAATMQDPPAVAVGE